MRTETPTLTVRKFNAGQLGKTTEEALRQAGVSKDVIESVLDFEVPENQPPFPWSTSVQALANRTITREQAFIAINYCLENMGEYGGPRN